MKGISLAFIFVLSFMIKVNAQYNSTLNFSFSYDLNPFIVCDSINELDSVTHLQVTDLKFYISKITFLKNKKKVFEEKNSYHLIDASKTVTQKIKITPPKLINADEVVFYLGIDSVTNTSGALGGDLDPTKGMFWTWQSGYINFKLEGKSNLCKTRNNEYQFHIGGYAYPYYCLEKVTFPIKNVSYNNIQIDVKKLIELFNLSEQNKIMSPNKDAVLLSKKITTCFSLIKP